MKSFLSCKQVNLVAGVIQKVAFTGEFFAVKSMTGDFTFRMRENDDFVPGAVGLEYHFEPDEEFKELELSASSNVTIFFYYGAGKFTLGTGKKTFRALFAQSSSPGDAPNYTIIENTIGPMVSSWQNPGSYRLTLAGAFPAGKTFVTLNISDAANSSTIAASRFNNDIIQINAQSGGDDGWTDMPIEIIVYP